MEERRLYNSTSEPTLSLAARVGTRRFKGVHLDGAKGLANCRENNIGKGAKLIASFAGQNFEPSREFGVPAQWRERDRDSPRRLHLNSQVKSIL